MKIKLEIDWRKIPDNGYVIYDTNISKLTKLYCRWWLYPVFRLTVVLRTIKFHLYRFLNSHNVMHTPAGCYMRLSDIWKKVE